MPSEDDELVLVGHGPVATVYAGESDDTAFALKIYPGEVDRRSLRSVRAELATLAELRDRARILVADSVERRPGGTTALRMELCAQSLSELVEEAGRRPVDEAVALGEAPAETLAAAHDRGIVHGGVSPGNVLFEGSGDALLSDFGTTLRRHSSAESTPHGAVWTRPTIGPLRARGDALLSTDRPRAAPPRAGRVGRPLRVARAEGSGRPLDRPGVPPALADLVAQLLAKDPADRPGSLTPLQT
ncbi:protein kinase domain-containing protein [Saccharomonospora azurea]